MAWLNLLGWLTRLNVLLLGTWSNATALIVRFVVSRLFLYHPLRVPLNNLKMLGVNRCTTSHLDDHKNDRLASYLILPRTNGSMVTIKAQPLLISGQASCQVTLSNSSITLINLSFLCRLHHLAGYEVRHSTKVTSFFLYYIISWLSS